MRPPTLAALAQARNDSASPLAPMLCEFLDEFYGALTNGEDGAALIAEEPAPLASHNEHALLGAIGEHLARRWALAIPPWTNDPSRFLSRPYFTSPIEGLKALMIAESPLAFRRRLIFTEAEPLRRARIPEPRAPS